MYHLVTPRRFPTFQKYAVSPEAFAAQMAWLTRAGYNAITLDRLLNQPHVSTRAFRPIIITFDDGFRDSVEYAVPILQSHGFTAVFYLVVGLMGQTSRWLLQERDIEVPLIDWSAARSLEAAGFQCASHTISHPHLTALSPSACRDELLQSRYLLEDGLGREVRHLAYPFGSSNETVRAIAAESGYRSACSVRIGLSRPDDDPLALPRVPVNGHDSLLDFICRLRTAGTYAELLRAKAQRTWHRLRLRQERTA